MITRLTFSLLLLLLFSYLQTLTFTIAITSAPFNISHFLYPKISDEFRPQPSLFLKDVLEAISEKEKWKLEDVRVSKLEVGKARYGTLQRYEIRFRYRYGKSDLAFRLWDGVSLWKKFEEGGGDFESLVNGVSSNVVLDSFRAKGPFELIVAGDHGLSLMLPLNTSHTGLKRILVGEGITVEVKSAQEVSLFHTSDLGLRANRSLMNNREHSGFWSFPHLLCMPLLPIKIFGSASVVASRTRNPDAHIASALLSRETIELLPEKCYSRHTYKKQKCPIESLRLRISFLEKLLRRFLGDKTNPNAVWGGFKAKIQASTLFRFQLELERNIRSNDTHWTTMAEWRTRPTVERVWFEVLARIEAKRLKLLMARKVKPFIGVDSSAWSNLMSNISFTKFPSLLVPPEALTLDVKW